MLEFLVEWHDAPGVDHRVLACTWCRLTIQAGGSLASRLYDRRTKGSRDGVYGSAFPLCRWLVENYWFLTSEPYKSAARYGSRDLARSASDRAWVKRHSLLAAREGGALPDLTMYRDGDMVTAHWLKDGGDNTNEHIRFVGEGSVRLRPEVVRGAIARFVEAVLDRVSDLNDDEVLELREDWEEIQGLTEEDRHIFECAARLGVDARFEDELSPEHENLLRTNLPLWGKDVADDLLSSSTIGHFSGDASWIEEARALAGNEATERQSSAKHSPLALKYQKTAHLMGHAYAVDFRNSMDIPNVIRDMENFVRDLGWAETPFKVTNSSPSSVIRGFLGYSEGDAPVLVAPVNSENTVQERFLLARSLYMCSCSGSGKPRLVTDSHTWDQRASRAFAAEILAPAEGLRDKIRSPKASPLDVQHLAEDFGVSTEVIRHQMENYDVAIVGKTPSSDALW